MGIDEVLELVNLPSEQAPQSVDTVRERYNQRAEAEWNDLPSKVRAGVAFKLADLWDRSIEGHVRKEEKQIRKIRDHFREYEQDPN